MIIELHILQNFAPSNLNRDDTGSPKDCEFGGYRRARISSQCFKKAIRDYFKSNPSLLATDLALRSKRLHDHLAELLKALKPQLNNFDYCLEAVLTLCGIYLVEEKKSDEDDNGQEQELWVSKSEYLAFLGKDTLSEVAQLIQKNKPEFEKAGEIIRKYREDKRVKKDYKGHIVKDDKKDLRGKIKKALGKEIVEKIEKSLDGSRAADLALFGRMLADLPEKNIDAASQVAHAISTNKASIEFDFYTAVDDLRPEDTQGSDMLGTVEFNSACFYRYANIDVEQLKTNLDEEELAHKTIAAFIRAAVTAVPSGKQNSMAAQNPPSFVFVVAREAGLWSLVNAFVKPVRPTQDGDLIENSIKALDEYWGQLAAMYGAEQIRGKWVASLTPNGLTHLKNVKVNSVGEIINKVCEQLKLSSKAGVN